MRTIIAIPPIRVTGGIAVLYQVASRLQECGFPVALAGIRRDSPLPKAETHVEVIPWGNAGEGLALTPDDMLLIPEGWPNLMAPALTVGARICMYVQNWAYLFSALPDGVNLHRLPVSFLAVSQPVSWFVETLAVLPLAGIVRPAIDAALFHPEEGARPDGRIRIAWMPRKNKGLAEQIRYIAAAMLEARDGLARIEWVEIHGMAPEDVAHTLRSCHIFMCTGFPEGCPLPPLEAMASGCLVTGFAGFGGWDYMRQAYPDRYLPRIPLRDVPWGGNGLFAADGDVVEAARNLVDAITMVRENSGGKTAPSGADMAGILNAARATAAWYSLDAQREAVRSVWSAWN